jgi:hypothetical protein
MQPLRLKYPCFMQTCVKHCNYLLLFYFLHSIMKFKNLVVTLALVAGWYSLTSTINDPNNPPVARTGAPGETTCGATGCHSGGTYTGTVAISGIPDTVVANQSYSVTLTQTSNAVRGGYELTCLDGNNAKCGTLTAATGTSIGNNNSTGRQYARQSTPKNLSNGSASWTFTWKAPASANGNTARFYYVSLGANGNGQKSGDKVFMKADTSVFATAVSAISNIGDPKSVEVYPSVVTDQLHVDLKSAENGILRIYNMQGRLYSTTALKAAQNTISVTDLPGGYYVAQVEVNGKTVTKRFVR